MYFFFLNLFVFGIYRVSFLLTANGTHKLIQKIVMWTTLPVLKFRIRPFFSVISGWGYCHSEVVIVKNSIILTYLISYYKISRNKEHFLFDSRHLGPKLCLIELTLEYEPSGFIRATLVSRVPTRMSA